MKETMVFKINEISGWIIENLETANNFGSKGIVPVDIGENYITFQKIGHPVEYSWNLETGILTRVDSIYDYMDDTL